MSEQELLYRIERLEQEKRRWKVVGIVSLCLLGFLLLLGSVGVGVGVLASVRMSQQAQEERDRAEQARRQAEMERMKAEEAMRKAKEER